MYSFKKSLVALFGILFLVAVFAALVPLVCFSYYQLVRRRGGRVTHQPVQHCG